MSSIEKKSCAEVIERLLCAGSVGRNHKYCGQYQNDPDGQDAEGPWRIHEASIRSHYLNVLTSLNESTE